MNMSRRKRKQKSPEQYSEEKRAKMTWNMFDLATFVCDEFDTTPFISASEADYEATRRSTTAQRKERQASDPESMELNLENAYSKHSVCQLGIFSISLCTSKEQADEIRISGTSVSSTNLVDTQWNFDNHTCVIVRLTFDRRHVFTTTLSEVRDLCGQDSSTHGEVDFLKQVSFRAIVPRVTPDKLEALVYLQNRGVISLILKPEQKILDHSWEVIVCLNKSGLSTPSFASAESTNRKIDKMMKVLMIWFHETSFKTGLVDQNGRNLIVDKGFDKLYDSIKAVREKLKAHTADSTKQEVHTLQENSFHCNPSVREWKCNENCCGEHNSANGLVVADVQHPNLKPMLRGYQRKAVEWMLRREYGCQMSCLGNQIGGAHLIHPLWHKVHTLDGKLIYFNPYTGRVTKERFPLPLLPLGGILADEMGLGKTVEVIACILCHPKPTSEHKSLNEGRATYQTLSGMQTNGSKSVSSCTTEGSNFALVQVGHSSHQGESDSCVTKPDCKSQSNDSMNTREAVLHKVQESTCNSCTCNSCTCNSQTAECAIYGQAGTSCGRVQSDHKLWSHGRTADESTDETLATDVKGCLSSKLARMCDNKKASHSHAIKQEQHRGFSGRPNSNSSQIAPSLPKFTNHEGVKIVSSGSSVHKEVNNSATASDMEKFSEEKDGSQFLCSENLSESERMDSSKALLPTQSNCVSSGNLKPEEIPDKRNSCADQSKAEVAVQDDLEAHTSSSTCSQHLSVKETGTIKCQCICGVTAAKCHEKLLHCCDCQAVFHGQCLAYDFPKEFICPHCALKRPAVPSGATLIISPAPIAQQWMDEVCRHTQPSSLKLMVYKGVAKSGFILPEVLADHDVILTTYATLRSDFYHLGSQQGNAAERSLRYNKRYVALPSPLTAVLFWRICLDEAQMVESTTARAAEVALHLKSVHRWCVTGTPIQKGLADIYGLLLFLGVDPYCNQKWWKTLLYEPYKQGQTQPLCDLLAKIMWRSAKKDVIHEIQLPDQDERVKWLTFSPVEQHFYRRQHEECAGTATRMLNRWESTDTVLSTIDRHTVHLLLNPLLRLRQACCHPQAVRGGYLSMQKSTLTMDKLLENLISKAKLECEEAHRQLLFAFNGLAGIHILKEEWADAVNMYREAMRSWTEHEATFRTDALQKLHTLFNLSDILSRHQEGCSRTLRDDKLQDEVKELKSNYTARVNVQVTAAQENLGGLKSNIAEIRNKIDFQSPWWMGVLHYAATRGIGDDLCQRIKDELSATDVDVASIGRFTDLRGLQYHLCSKLDLIESTHNNLVVALGKLTVMPSTQMVQASAECCLRPTNNSQADRCAFCEVDDIFTEYESRIFGHQGMKGVDEQDLQPDESLDWHRHGNTGGLRAESELEKVLKVIHNFVKTNKISSAAQQEGRHHLNLIESLRKEFKFLRALWFALRERVSCLDELDMCTTRLRLQLPGEPATDDIHVIHPLQLDQQRLKFTSDRVVAQTELRKKIGQLLYLNNLAKTQTCHDGKNPDPCPVCVKQLGVQWSVFSCGHCICCQCVWVLLRQAGIGPRHRNVHVKCPLCRIPTVAQEISYVSTARTQAEEAQDNVTVKGSHSTKVEAIVRTLLAIKSADSAAKCLVFSTWQDVLAVISKALDENDIKHRHITGSRHFQENLQTFKQDPLVGVLLLPLQSGSNGLNIIEATHVLLVEPALNPAHELQAVGRVHRIGQTKPTHVFRFIIRGTVESRMCSLLRSKPTDCVRPGARDSENSSLTLGELASLFNQDDDNDDEQCKTGIFGLHDEYEASPDRL